jgi:protein SCO1/2
MNKSILLICLIAILSGCIGGSGNKLPVLGNKEIVNGDTIYHTVPDFNFIDQDSLSFTPANLEGKIYVVDFFFISCPTICPKVKKQMLRIHKAFTNENNLVLVSHTIDTKRDTVERLHSYAKSLKINTDQWKLVTGERDEIYSIAEDYFSIAKEDPDAPGGFDHSGRLILIDKEKKVRSFCDGTDAKDVDRFMDDIRWLLASYEN